MLGGDWSDNKLSENKNITMSSAGLQWLDTAWREGGGSGGIEAKTRGAQGAE